MGRADDILTSRIQGIDIDTQVNRFGRADSIPDLLDNTGHANRIYLSCLYNLEAAVSVVVVVT